MKLNNNSNQISDENSEFDFYSELSITAENPKAIISAYHALEPETHVMITPRGKTTIELKDEKIIIMKFFATDFISLRAMLGSFLRWLDAAFSSIEVNS